MRNGLNKSTGSAGSTAPPSSSSSGVASIKRLRVAFSTSGHGTNIRRSDWLPNRFVCGWLVVSAVQAFDYVPVGAEGVTIELVGAGGAAAVRGPVEFKTAGIPSGAVSYGVVVAPGKHLPLAKKIA
jgi:hypothetical protein